MYTMASWVGAKAMPSASNLGSSHSQYDILFRTWDAGGWELLCADDLNVKAWEFDFLRALQAPQPNGLGQILEARGFNSMSFKHWR